jgi:hypothetical protein
MPEPAPAMATSRRPHLHLIQGRKRNSPVTHPAEPLPDQAEAGLCTARVCELQTGPDGTRLWSVTAMQGGTNQPDILARQAAGCLLEPAPGDVVLILRQDSGDNYVLNVLEKQDPGRALRFPGDLALDVSQGRCTLRAQDLDMTGMRTASLRGREVTLAGQEGRMRFVRLDVLARTLEARIQDVKSLGEKIQIAASNLTSRLGRVLRLTGHELHRARSVRTEVEQRFAVQAGQVSVLAEEEVSVDGEKIHLG